VRERLEIAYEDEKQKSALILRCSRIYHEFLCKQDRVLYEHLMQMQVSPELHLMRWLRCMLSREFEVEPVLHFWDYMLGGVYLQYTDSHQNSWNPKS
jgi:TBC1 domain family protein 5